MKKRRLLRLLIVILAVTWGLFSIAHAQSGGQAGRNGASSITIDFKDAEKPTQLTVGLRIFLALTVLSIAPSILIMVTSFTRIAVVISLLRQAIGTQQMPPNQIVIGISLFLTFFIMSPVWKNMNENAVQPYLKNEINQVEALEKAAAPLMKFMAAQTREKDLSLFIEIAKIERPHNMSDVPFFVLVPAFLISELKTAFQIGFLLYVPFLIIDMVVSSVLLAMGMMMLPPVMVALPFKLMLFVMADGWYLVIGSIVKSFK